MANRMRLTWQGEEYEAVRKSPETSGEPAAVWQVLRDGALLTSFPADGADSAGEVREKALGWLEANRSRPEADVGRQ